jgi:hypothetical protein
MTNWADMGMTILWAVSALAAILYGMKKRRVPHRYFGLGLFALATLKVLIVDSSELKGLERIGAFIITGILLLVLSFAYQKASAYFQPLEEGNGQDTRFTSHGRPAHEESLQHHQQIGIAQRIHHGALFVGHACTVAALGVFKIEEGLVV